MKQTYEMIGPERVLAVDPSAKGFGFVVLEKEPLQLVDWGVASCRRRGSAPCFGRLSSLIEQYKPAALVIDDPSEAKTPRRVALGAFLIQLSEHLEDSGVPTRLYRRSEVMKAFSSIGARTKSDVVQALVDRFPELASRVPRPRQIWEGEDARLSIFDALALAMLHLSIEISTSRQQN